MLSENNILQNKSFSIHFFKNGFSFCTDDNINYFSHPTDKIEFENSIKNFLNNNRKTFEYFSIIFFQQPSTLIPTIFFDKKRLDEYLNFYFKKPETEIIVYDELKKEDNTNVYSIPKKAYDVIEKLDVDFNVFHYTSILIKKILTLCSTEKFSKQLLFIYTLMQWIYF